MDGLDNVAKPKRITYRSVTVDIVSANKQCKNEKYTLDGNIARVTGIAVKPDKVENEARAYDLTIGCEISGSSILVDEFEGSLLFHSPAVPTQNRFLPIDEPRAGGEVKFNVTDRNMSGAATYPYKLTFILRCELA